MPVSWIENDKIRKRATDVDAERKWCVGRRSA
jgi:hypothetical protein